MFPFCRFASNIISCRGHLTYLSSEASIKSRVSAGFVTPLHPADNATPVHSSPGPGGASATSPISNDNSKHKSSGFDSPAGSPVVTNKNVLDSPSVGNHINSSSLQKAVLSSPTKSSKHSAAATNDSNGELKESVYKKICDLSQAVIDAFQIS